MSSALDRARAAFDAGDKKQAASALDAVIAFTSSDLKNEWQTLSKKADKAGR